MVDSVCMIQETEEYAPLEDKAPYSYLEQD